MSHPSSRRAKEIPAFAGTMMLPLLLILTFLGCSPSPEMDVRIPFSARIDGAAFSCDSATAGFQPFDLRFFVHAVDLIDAAGRTVALKLTDDQAWQSHDVALLDFENGTGSCADGSAGTHTVISGKVPDGKYRGLRFVLGVPFELNHANPAEADAPLNLGHMHWGWQGGYKFMRFEGQDGDGTVRLHLGSTGCEGTIGKISRCTRPNRATVQLDSFELGASIVQIELGALLRHPDDDHGRRDCMSEVDDPGCRTAFAALGLDLTSGVPGDVQSLFSAQHASELIPP